MPLKITWDSRKALANRRKHGVDFQEAATVFQDPRSITVPDASHSTPDEDRYVTIGRSAQAHMVVVAHLETDEEIRLISARSANRAETNQYDES